MMSGYQMNSGGWLFMGLMSALVLAGIVVLVWAMLDRGRAEPNNARRILDHRFASGEISIEDYQSGRRLLG